MKIFLAGYYGFGNLGDDLLLEAATREIHYTRPKATIYVLHKDRRPFSHPEVIAVSRRNIGAILIALLKSDYFILGGGGLLQDKTSLASLGYYLGLAWLAAVMGCVVSAWGVGVEEIKTGLGRWMTRLTMNHLFSSAIFRNEDSLEFLRSMGVTRPILFTPDLVFSLSDDVARIPPQRPSPMTLLFVARSQRSMECGVQLRELIEAEGGRVAIRVFAKEDLRPGTRVVCDIEQWRSDVSDASLVLSARLHGLILAALSGRPFVGYGEERKLAWFCRAWGMPFVGAEASLGNLWQALKEASAINPGFMKDRCVKYQSRLRQSAQALFAPGCGAC